MAAAVATFAVFALPSLRDTHGVAQTFSGGFTPRRRRFSFFTLIHGPAAEIQTLVSICLLACFAVTLANKSGCLQCVVRAVELMAK